MPWVDVGDTVSINDGTHQLKGTVLANPSGYSSITVLNSGYEGHHYRNNGHGFTGYDSLCPCPAAARDFIYGCDDFVAPYGQTPALIATCTTHISTAAQYIWMVASKGSGGSTQQKLLIDRVEWLFQTSQSRLFLGENLMSY